MIRKGPIFEISVSFGPVPVNETQRGPFRTGKRGKTNSSEPKSIKSNRFNGLLGFHEERTQPAYPATFQQVTAEKAPFSAKGRLSGQ